MLDGKFTPVHNVSYEKISNIQMSTVLPNGFPTIFLKQDRTIIILTRPCGFAPALPSTAYNLTKYVSPKTDVLFWVQHVPLVSLPN